MFRKNAALFITLIFAVSAGCSNPVVPELKEYVEPSAFELVIKTDFEKARIQGESGDNWHRLIFDNLANPKESNLPIEKEIPFGINYEDGGIGDRYACLTQDPTDPKNQVLHYWMKNAVIDGGYKHYTKGRIQVAINPQDAGRELQSFYLKYRLYLHPDLALLKEYPSKEDRFWSDVTIQQIWMGFENAPAPAEISLHIGPDKKTGALRIAASSSDTKSKTFWGMANKEIELPVGEWLTVETGYKMGDAKSGRFKVEINSISLGGSVTVIDVHDVTYNPKAANPVGISHWQPLKLYTGENITHFIRDRGGVLQLYWDDFEFSETWPVDW